MFRILKVGRRSSVAIYWTERDPPRAVNAGCFVANQELS